MGRILHSAGARLGEHMVTKTQIDRIATASKRWRRNQTVSSTSGMIAMRLKKRCSNGTTSRRQVIVSLDKLASLTG